MENLIDWLKLPKYASWPIVLVCALLLWGPSEFKKGLGLDLFIEQYRIWVGVVLLFFLGTGVSPVFPWAAERSKNLWLKRKRVQWAKRRAADLTPEEKKVLRKFVVENTRSRDLNVQNGVVSGLIKVGFLELAFDVSYGGQRGSFTFPVNIQEWAWNYLRENPHLLAE